VRASASSPLILFACGAGALLAIGLPAGCGSVSDEGSVPAKPVWWQSLAPSWSPDGRKIVLVRGPCKRETAPVHCTVASTW
jgi:hypothetical protein